MSESNVLHTFICYRQTDGRAVAEWLFENFNKREVTQVDADDPQTLNVYLDVNAPAVSNWVSLHRPALELSRVMFIVCSPGAFAKQGREDWVHTELEWWLKHRETAPILIDTTGDGARWVPAPIRMRWPYAQRIEVRPDYWNGLSPEQRQKEEERAIQRLIGGIVMSGTQVTNEELASKRRMVRRLGMLTALLAIAVGLAVIGIFVANRSRNQAELATQESQSRLANLYVETFDRYVENQDVYGALPWCIEALISEPDPVRATQHRIRVASAMRQSPQLVNIWWHDDKVVWAIANHSGDRVATAGADGTVVVWDVKSGQRVIGPLQHNEAVTYCAFDDSDQYLVTTSADNSARVWSMKNGTPVSPVLQHDGPVNQAAFPPRSSSSSSSSNAPTELIVATCGDDQTVRLWNVESGRPLREPLKHDGPVTDLAFSPDGKLLAGASRQTVKVWQTDTWKAAYSQNLAMDARFERGQGTRFASMQVVDLSEIYQMFFSKDSRELFVGSDQINIFDAATGEPLVEPILSGAANSVGVISPEGSMIALTRADDVRIMNIRAERPAVFVTEHQKSILHAAFRPDGERLATASADGTVRLWMAWNGRTHGPPLSHSSDVVFVSYTGDGQHLLTIDNDGLVRMWKLPPSNPIVHMLDVTGTFGANYAFSSRGSYIATFPNSSIGKFRLWNVDTGELLTDSSEQINDVSSFDFNADKTRLAVGTGKWDGQEGDLRIWDVQSGRPLTAPMKHGMPVNHVAFSPEGSLVATGAGSTAAWIKGAAVTIWNLETSEQLYPPIEHEEPVTLVAWSPDGSLVASASGRYMLGSTMFEAGPGGADLWDARSGGRAAPHLSHDGAVTDLEFSHDGRILVTSSADRKVRIWDVASGKLTVPPLEHRDSVWFVSFGPRGNQIVTVSGSKDPRQPDGMVGNTRENGEARIWDVITGNPVTGRLIHDGLINGASFSPDGKSLLTFSEDLTARVWDTATGRPLTAPLPHYESVRVQAGQFRESGGLVDTFDGDSLYEWDLSSDQSSIPQLKLMAELLAARQIDETGALVYLTAEQIQKKWRQAVSGPSE